MTKEAIKQYASSSAYCLKFYSAELDTKSLDILKDRSIVREKLLDDLLDQGQSIDIENYDLIDFLQYSTHNYQMVLNRLLRPSKNI